MSNPKPHICCLKNSAKRSLFPKALIHAGLALLLCGAWAAGAAEPPRPFAHPDRIRYDSHSLIIDGKPVFIYSGSFHYYRCPKPLWRERFEKIRQAGFNAVQTYVPWNWSERRMPASLNDYSKVKLSDLDDWLTMAEQFGLYTIVRPGPYICAEWDTGGFPQWLLTKKPARPRRSRMWLRTDDPVFLAWCRHWYNAVCPIIAKHQITRKAPGQPGVILVQLENEYDYAGLPAQVMINQVKALAQTALDDGIDVPLFTCWTRPVRGSSDPLLRHLFDSCNFYPRWGVNGIRPRIEQLRREQPDAPLMTTELQGGWFSQVGGRLSVDQDGLSASQINNLTLFAIQNGDTLLNYYMLFGGTNPGGWAARRITTTYDYDAPSREWGGVGDRYQRVWALGHMLRQYGAQLARAKAVPCMVTGTQPDVTVAVRQAPDGSRFLFVRTYQHNEPRSGTAYMKLQKGDSVELVFNYSLEPFGSKVLYLAPGVNDAAQGQWLPKPAPPIQRPAHLPAFVSITTARCQADPGPSHWRPLTPGEDLAQAGISDSGFIFYRARLGDTAKTNLMVQYPAGDGLLAAVDGRIIPPASSTQSGSVFSLPAGADDVRLLYENLGHANGGVAMQNPCGILSARLLSGALTAGTPIAGWRMREVGRRRRLAEVRPDYDDANWTPVAVNKLDADSLPSGHTAVYRAAIELTLAQLKGGSWDLNFGRIDDRGWVFVNGRRVGMASDWARSYSFDVTSRLHPGRNVIAVLVHNDNGAGGLGLPSLSEEPAGTQGSLRVSFGRPAGVEHHWWRPGLDDSSWQSVGIGGETGSPEHPPLLTWYRMTFALPSPKPGVWVPWHLSLQAAGNGFLYLNGHAIGRYWEVGPQRDFFLPACWLHFGSGQMNTLAVSLRPVDRGVEIGSAMIAPYANSAEVVSTATESGGSVMR